MKKIIAAFIVILMLLCALIGCAQAANSDTDYLRIHIRADSNEKADQEIKLVVRDSVIEYLSPYLSKAENAVQAEKIVKAHAEDLEAMIDELLFSCGFTYTAHVVIDTEYFEKNTYGDLVLDSGYYRAVIVNLGSGSGKNWWCVAYPPLCFTLGEDYDNVNYKSILYEIIKNKENK
jgi:stage II sporulation protein R